MIIKCNKLLSATTKKEMIVSPWVTLNKRYVVLGIEINKNHGIMALIKSDHRNQPIFVDLDGFEIVSQQMSQNWVLKIVDNFYHYFLPKKWAYNDFLSELEDEKPKAMKLFQEETEMMYQEEEVNLKNAI